MRMRVKRLQEMMEGKYAYRLSGVMKYSNQRGCMNIIKIYEQRIRELLEFCDFRDMSSEKIYCFFTPFLSGGICATFIHVGTGND